MTIGYLVSGNLGLITLDSLSEEFQPSFVITDRGSFQIIEFCNQRKIEVFVGRPTGEKFSNFKTRVGAPDLLVSINFLFLIGKEVIEWSKMLPINIHGSMLPKYRGRAPHIWAIINGETEVGISVHQIEEGCDTGAILYQESIKLDRSMTGGMVLEIFCRRYPDILRNIIPRYAQNLITPRAQNENAATYFGKRAPEDGRIVWSWTSDRIQNWVRALTHPYPGAFSFLNGVKIIILEVQVDRCNPDNFVSPGTILNSEDGCLWVKCLDGILKIVRYEMSSDIAVNAGDVLD